MGNEEKVEKYNWSSGGDRGKRMLIDVDDLRIDDTYQRAPVDRKTHLAIARGFSWVAFGVLAVMQRADGKMYIVDGQQRWLAAKIRGEKRVPCSVMPSSGPKEEAAQFYLVNTGRKSMYSVDKFKAQARSGSSPHVEIDRWLTSQNFTVARASGHPNNKVDGRDVIACIGNVVQQWQANKDNAQRAVLAARTICQEHVVQYMVLRGCFCLLQSGIDPMVHLRKIMESGGMTAILKTIKANLLECGLAYASDRLCGQAILVIINKGKRSGRLKLISAEAE
jgi:hypothetical protein